MIDVIDKLWQQEALSPHGICLLWRPELIWTHAISDLLIGLSYFSIPIALGVFAIKRPDISFGWVTWCFAAFILACGTTHFMSVWTLWIPDYPLEALIKLVTAAVSVATAILLWPLLPKIIALPSPAMMAALNSKLTESLHERDQAMVRLQAEVVEREQVQAQLRTSQKMEAIGQLTGGVAHDFNNLLTIIGVNVDRIEREWRDASERVRSGVQNIRIATSRGSGLIRHLLAFARRQTLQPEVVDIGSVVAELLPLLASASSPNVHVEIKRLEEPLLAEVDRGQLEQAILNIVINSSQAARDQVNVTIEVRRHQEGIVIDVRDDGPGMASDVAEKAFEPFFTTKPVGQGSGLGLSHVFGFAQQSGGRAELETAPGSGTSVRIILPEVRP